MNHHEVAVPMKAKFFTTGTKIVFAIMVAGLLALAYRFIAGLGAVTNLDNQYPWGIWIGIDVASGVALAAGGFTTAALADIFHKEKYHVIVRPALLTAMLGYTFVAIGVITDLGRFYNIWHPMMPDMWQGNSVLFEVGICVMIYVTVLYIEFLPIAVERFKGKVNLPFPITFLNKIIESFLSIADRTLCRFVSLFIIAGVVLSCLHQSSLGTLMVIAPSKMHTLWYTSISPLLFLLSAIAVGFPMVIFESILASRSFKLKPELKILSSIARYTPALLGVYVAIKIGDITIRNAWPAVFEGSIQSWSWLAEMVIGAILPIIILATPRFRNTISGLFTGAVLVILGVALNRINVFVIAYKPLYADYPYIPSFLEVLVTAGFICTLIILYRAFVMIFPIISVPVEETPEEKEDYRIKSLF